MEQIERSDEQVPQSVSAGARLGEWVLEEPLGRGAYAEVWRARHNSLERRRVAIKVPHDPTYAALLRKEGKLQDGLAGDHVVGVLGLDPDHDPPYLVMELVEGGTLRDRLDAADGPLPLEDALRWLREITLGLQTAHGEGVIHRDLKPANVLLDGDGSVHVADFGLGLTSATAPDELLSASLQTRSHQELAGTLRYMAPEQRDPEGEVDARADLFALGVILFELITGEAPVGGELPSDVVPGLDPRLDELYRKLCARLAQRFASADAVLEALEPLIAAPPSEAPDPAVAGAERCTDVPAGLTWRALALGIDVLPFMIAIVGPFRLGRGLGLVGAVLLFVVYDLVAVTLTGRTLGKKLCGIRVTNLAGEPPDPAQAIQREAFRLVSLASLGLAYLPLLAGRPPFHDAWADTRVLHDR